MIVISSSSLFVRHRPQGFETEFETSWRVSNARQTPKVTLEGKQIFVENFLAEQDRCCDNRDESTQCGIANQGVLNRKFANIANRICEQCGQCLF
jgi:hypothetical protein